MTVKEKETVTKPKPNSFADRSFDGIDYTVAVLQFQIAELHKIKGKQLVDEGRFFGIDSEIGTNRLLQQKTNLK